MVNVQRLFAKTNLKIPVYWEGAENEKSDFIEVTKMMPTIGIMTIVSAALTIYLCHDEYKNGKMSSKNFKIVAICEGFAILGMIFLIIS